MAGKAIIEVRDLSVGFTTRAGDTLNVLKGVDLTVCAGETVGIVGESGSGKSTLALATMGFLKPGLRKTGGHVQFDGQDVFAMSPQQLEDIRGGKLGLIPQNSGQALTPTMRIGAQLCESLTLHCNLEKEACAPRAEDLLSQVRLRDVKAIMRRFPHELSGGQQQRVAIAMALAGEPEALVLDEPTTGLDVTTQIHILDLLRDLAVERNMAMVMVSHDLGVIGRCCQTVTVMLSGEVVQNAPSQQVLCKPEHPYAKQLLDATPRLMPVAQMTNRLDAEASEALCLQNLALSYRQQGFWERTLGKADLPLTVDGVSVSLKQGETLGLVGESGSGKSTILKAIAGILPPRDGAITVAGGHALPERIDQRSPTELRRIQLIFQNPDQALNPRHTALGILSQPLQLYFGMKGNALRDRAVELLERMRLSADYLDRFPGQMSGGEKQRLAIARAFAAEPEIVLCDEVTSALDVSVQASVMDLLQDLKREKKTTYVFVSHDLAVVQQLADQIVVLKQGRVCEQGSAREVYGNPQDEYTQKLFDAVLEPEPG
ncbi:ABC transporter ATP-binding protein [Roseovarius phycicola]|uniref:ABC transporter ATP-binding protein n=1 Tax=Roseovarius phycicola TaxID=3080976 RepID=A0ABZ2HN78_9RHOB